MTKVAIWSFPTRVLFGAGAAGETGNEAKRLGLTRALLVTDKGVVATGLLAPVVEALRKAGIHVATFDGVDSNPVEKNVDDGVLAYRESGAELIIAVGGG